MPDEGRGDKESVDADLTSSPPSRISYASRVTTGTPYKWLNLAELCRLSLPGHLQINRIRYFTAIVKARPSDPDKPERQKAYIRALQTIPNLTVHLGQFREQHIRMPLAKPSPQGDHFATVIKTEEKGSDVNRATYLLVDAYERVFEAAVVISDDSDLVEPINIARRRLGHQVTVLSPRGQAREISRAATRFRQIDPLHLAASQFPPTLTDAIGTTPNPRPGKRPIRRALEAQSNEQAAVLPERCPPDC